VYSGKGAREEAAKALTYAVLARRNDPTLQTVGAFRGFEILRKGTSDLPGIFIRGAGMYRAHVSPENPFATVQSIEHTLRSLAQRQERVKDLQKTLADYQAQADRPFEHEARLKELLVRQAQVNALLDLDKGERQVADPAREFGGQPLQQNSPRNLSKEAMDYMRQSNMADELQNRGDS
jgi:hypothetical protein